MIKIKEYSQRAFARELGCSVGYITKLVKQGRISLNKNKKIDYEKYKGILSPRIGAKPTKPTTPTSSNSSIPINGEMSVDEANHMFLVERAKHEALKKELQQIKIDKEKGELVAISEVKEQIAQSIKELLTNYRASKKKILARIKTHGEDDWESIIEDEIERSIATVYNLEKIHEQ